MTAPLSRMPLALCSRCRNGIGGLAPAYARCHDCAGGVTDDWAVWSPDNQVWSCGHALESMYEIYVCSVCYGSGYALKRADLRRQSRRAIDSLYKAQAVIELWIGAWNFRLGRLPRGGVDKPELTAEQLIDEVRSVAE